MDNLTKRLNELESKRGTFIGSNEYIEGFKEAMKLSEDFIKQLKKLWREILNDLNSVPEVNKSSVPEKGVTNEMIKNKNIFNRVLTPEEIKKLYENSKEGKDGS
jgi:archaellum component FlaC